MADITIHSETPAKVTINTNTSGGGTGSSQWGMISGTLSDQADLNAAFAAEQSARTNADAALRTSIDSVDSKVGTNAAGIATNKKNISAANSAIAENANSIEQLTEKTSGLPWQYQQYIGLAVGDTSYYNLPEAFDFVDSDFKQLLLEAYKEYRDSSDYEIDNDNRDCTTILKALSGRRIFATLYNSVFTDPDRGYQHNLHFKPWQIVFYDKIVKLSDDLTGYATPTLLIEFDTDTTEYFNQQFSIAPVGMEMNIDAGSWDYIDSNGDIVGRVQINI